VPTAGHFLATQGSVRLKFCAHGPSSCYNQLMVGDDIPRYAALLKSQYLFQGFNDAQIAHVVNRFQRVNFAAGEYIITQGTAGDSFYVVFSGHVKVTRRVGQSERTLNVLGPGEYFGEEALLFDRPRSATIIAQEPVGLLRLDQEAFFDLIRAYPDMRLNLSSTAESRHIAHQENFDWVGEDEVIYLISRKHELFLFVSLVLPLITFLIGIPILVWGFSNTSPFMRLALIGGGILLMIGGLGWTLWNWLDWGNDYYVVTSQRVVWLERVIIFYYSRREAPLTHVLSVNTNSSFWGRVFNYGDVDVRTFTGGIKMRHCPNPKRFASFVEGFQLRARRIQKEAEAENIERDLRARLGLAPPRPPAPAAAPAETVVTSRKPARKAKPGSLRDKLDTFLQVRYERDGVITYRKHWLVLLGKTWQPILVFLLLLFGFIYLVWPKSNGVSMFSASLVLLLGFLYMIVFLWWGYNYWDWSDDIYQLTPDQVLDIERRPLGEEDKKTAPLDSILSLEHSREGIIQLIFNYGNVIINVGQTKFIFKGVHNPDQVHQDVADYIEARRRKKQDGEAARERQRMTDWFATYQKQSKYLEEPKSDHDWDIFPG
jgi:hypothetical protein